MVIVPEPIALTLLKGYNEPMKKKLSPEDLQLWQSQLKDVKPLSTEEKTREELLLPKKPKVPQPKAPSLERHLGNSYPSVPLQNFGRKELRHLKIDGRLDMHGMSMDQAYQALEQFLLGAQKRGFKIVLIITGKGALSSENTLRRQLPRWIKETPIGHLVSTLHHPAKPQDGGQGAFYLGLRKGKR